MRKHVWIGVCAVVGTVYVACAAETFVFTKATAYPVAAGQKAVQEGPVSNLCWGAASASLDIKGDVTFRGGFFTGEKQSRQKGYPTTLIVRAGAVARIAQTPILTPGVDFRQTQPGTVRLAAQGNQYRDWYVQHGTLVCEGANVLNPDRGLVLWGQAPGTVDLNGFNQNVSELRATDAKCDPATRIVNSGTNGILVVKRYLRGGREMPPGWYGDFVVVRQHDGRLPPRPTKAAYPVYKASSDIRVVHERDGIGNFLAKCRAGKPVTVAYFGGSITAMKGWRDLTTKWLGETYPKAKITEVAASIGGTGSDLGVFRLAKDVLAKNPDLVFVEFAVNDGDKRPRDIWRQMEGIVRQIWRRDPQTDIAFCYTVAGGIFDTYAKGAYNRSAGAMEQVAEHYGIPSISLGVPAVELYKKGKLVVSRGYFATAVPKEDPDFDRKVKELMAGDKRVLFANDGVHPRPEGHALYLEAVKKAFAAMDGSQPIDHAPRLATPFVPDNWEAAKVFPVTADVLHGDWAPDPERPGTFMTHTPGASLKFSFAGSVLRLRMCYQPDGGIMSAKIDGKPIADVVGFDQYSTYVRGGSVTLYDGADGIHEVELTLTDREPDRTILSRQLKEPAKELAAPKYKGTTFRVSQLMIIGDLLGERTLTVAPDGLSPQQALETIRAAKKGGDTSAWTVDVKPGLYTLREPLTFTPEDSGTAAAPVTWRGAGEASEISGGAPLVGWRDTGKGWFETDAPTGADGEPIWFEMLWVHDRRAANAPYPKGENWLVPGACAQEILSKDAKGKATRTRESLTVMDETLRQLLDAAPAAERPYVHLIVHQKWNATKRPVSDWQDSRLFTEGTVAWNWSQKWNAEAIYRVGNLRGAFTAPGEWFYDRSGRKVLYRPLPGETPQTLRALAPLAKLSRLIVVKGEPDKGRYVDQIRFEGLAFTASDATPIEGGKGPLTYYPGQAARAFDALLDATGARNFALTSCFVKHTGNIGFRLRDGCFSNRVTRCVFSDLGAGGVWFGADAVRLAKDEKYPVGRREIFGYHPRANAFNVLEDCIIRDGGHYNAMGTGVVIGHASDCRVEHCEIADFYYSGVSVGWQWAYLPTAAMRNVVRFNRIHDLGKGVLSDMGGVYTLGTAFGTRVTDNVIYNVSSRTYGGWGLYADEGSEGIVFARNLVYNTHDGGFHQHYGAGNTVQNNIFAWNEQNGVIRTVRANVFNVRSSLNVVANIVLTDRGDLASAGVRGVEGVWANNLWFDPNGEAKLDGLTWEKWRACGKEVNGRYADPKFVDARNFDFRLKPDSPAFALGFQPFDYTRAGVRGLAQDSRRTLPE